MKTKNELVAAIQDRHSAEEMVIKALKIFDTAKAKIILNDPVYGAAKNADVRTAYLTEKLSMEQRALEKAEEELRRCKTVQYIAEVEWSSEKRDQELSIFEKTIMREAKH